MNATDTKDKKGTAKTKTMDPEVKRLMQEIDANVKRLIDEVRFILKYRVIFRGRGLEFESLREYSPTDDASLIDWKISRRVSASKKIDKLYIKIYDEERDLNIFVLMDTSETMLFGTKDRLKSEYAAILAGTLIYTAIEVGDNAGLGMFNETLHTAILPSKSTAQYYISLKEMVNPKNYGGKCNLYNPLKRAIAALDRRSVLFIVSDFIGVGEGWEDLLKTASSKFEGVLGIMVRDERDSFIPQELGNFRLSDPLSKSVTEVDFDKIRKKFQIEAEAQEKRIEKIFAESNAGFIKCYTHEPFIKPLMKWFNLWGVSR